MSNHVYKGAWTKIAKEMNVSHSKVRRIVLKGSETVKQ